MKLRSRLLRRINRVFLRVGGEKMDKKKIEDVLKALEGISYLEWVKIKMGIDEYYRVESAKKTNEIQIADPNTIMPFIKSYCSTI